MSERQERNNNITESYHPRYRKGDFKFLQLNKRNNSTPAELRGYKTNLTHDILSSFNQINMQIGNLQEFFRARMDIHQEEILNIAHLQIKKIQTESENIVRKYSKLIEERNLSKELLSLKYQIKFYQERASEMFQQNGKLKEQIRKLKNQILMLKIGEESDHIAMRNISKKYLKEKTIRKKLELSCLVRDPKQLQVANEKLLFYTSVVNPENKQESSKQLSQSNQYKTTSLKKDFKIRLQKLSKHKNTRSKLKTEPTRFEEKHSDL